MELFCEKYGDAMESEVASCAHPEEYCQFRKKCLIHFFDQENNRKNKKEQQVAVQDNQNK